MFNLHGQKKYFFNFVLCNLFVAHKLDIDVLRECIHLFFILMSSRKKEREDHD